MYLKLISLLGLVSMVAVAWVLSVDRKRFHWRTVWWGLGLQLMFAIVITRTRFGAVVFEWAQDAVNRLNLCAIEGAKMVFGPLADEKLLANALGPQNVFIFVVSVSATIIVVSALSSLLYHLGILQRVVAAMAWVMQRAMRTSGSETLSAAANIFMGQTEAPLVIKPYLPRVTQSELLAIMVGGMATIAGGVAIAYVTLGVHAGHLLAASVMSAPASLMIAKIMLPEKEQSETADTTAARKVEKIATNSIDALCRGASDGVALAINVMAMLIAFVAVVALANFLLTRLQTAVGVAAPVNLQTIFGWVNAPFAWLMGVPKKDCVAIGAILGERIVLNEFIGYLSLTAKKAELDQRSVIITTYALCGFANFSSIAIQIGGIGALAPSRRGDLASLGLRAMIGGLLACYLTATVIGILL
ncbi:MAG TPA: nucleoside transporter C-terminal domain-containing protein [Candidatus Binatia bacterium]|nr:nucleoside transporter C-terminal domain-containing protein [Candidatus Binatia bacterium]